MRTLVEIPSVVDEEKESAGHEIDRDVCACPGFTDPINVKFANTPNAAKSMIGLPLAPSYLSGMPTVQQPVLTTMPPIRQPMNRYRYAILCFSRFGLSVRLLIAASSRFFCDYAFTFDFSRFYA